MHETPHICHNSKTQSIKAHTGVIGNEVADLIARKIRLGELRPRGPPIQHPAWYHGTPPKILNAWVLWEGQSRPPHFPPMSGQRLVPTEPDIPAAMPKWIELPHSAEATGNVHLRCATFNVHTLRQRGAVSFLRQQCEEHMLHIIGLQETRTPDAVTIDTSYMRFVGPATSGNGGVELWVSKTQQLCAAEGPTTLRREDVVVLHAESTLLIAKVRILGTVATCIVAHAPHRGHLRETINNWWTQLTVLLKQYRCTPPFILMIDANATVAAQQPQIGEHGAHDPDTAGIFFMHFCKTQEVALPCTFRTIHPGTTATMSESNALHQGTRNDYIGISQPLLDLCIASWVEPSLDAGHGKIDHLAVFLDIQWPIRTTTKRPPTVHFDRAKIAMATPETWEAFFQDWPLIPWHMDVTSHVKQVEEYLRAKSTEHFPKDPHHRRSSCMSDMTRDLYEQRRQVRKLLSSTRSTLELWMQQYAVDIWTGRCARRSRGSILLTGLRAAWRWQRYKKLSGNLKHGLRQDQAQWLQDRVGLIETHPTKDIAKLLRPLRMGKRVRHLGYRQLPQVHLEDGTLATTHEQTLTRWRSHFSTMEGGRNTSPEDLWETWQKQRAVFMHRDMPEDLDDVPTVFELEHFMRQSKCNKAMGHDLIPGELLHYAAPHMAPRLWPVMAKMSMWVDEPLQWKGGRLITAYKHKGSVQECGNYRALLVSSSLGKAMHNVWRRRVYPYVQSGASPMQFSAQHRALVTQASHCARLFAYQAEQNDRSCFLIFLDIQAAYYQLIRQHAVDLSFEDSHILEFLRRMGIDPMNINDLAAILSQPSALEQQGCPSHLHQMVSEVHRSTWWQLDADPTLTQTSKGTRPGDGFADILWSLVFSRYINKINECLTSLDICRSLSWNGEVAFLSGKGERSIPGGAIVWADDAVIAADHSDPHRMIPMLQTSMVIIINELIRLGMKPNMAKGKTEAMVILRGRGSKKVKQYLHCHCKGQVTLDMEQPEYQTLRVVSRYVHLGGVLTHDGRLKHEIRRRLAMAHDAIHPYRSKIFSNPKISLDKRVKLLQSTAMAALLYNVGTWPQLTKGEMRLWHGGVLRLYKTVFHRLYDIDTQFHMTMDQVIALTDLPSPELLLSLQRAKQLGHYLQRECDYFWALVGQGQYWMDVVYEDLRTLNAQVKGFTNLPVLDDERTCEIWQQQWQARPTKFKSLFRRAQAHHVGQTRLRYEVASFHERLHGILLQAGLFYSGMQEDVEVQPHYCLICSSHWPTFRAWAMHSFKKHGRLSKYRRLQQGSRCDACGTDYATHSRLCRHLRSSPACAATLAAQQHWVSPGLVTGNREADRIDDDNCLIPCIHTGGNVLHQRHGWAMTEEAFAVLKCFSRLEWNQVEPPDMTELQQTVYSTAIHLDELQEIVEAQVVYYQNAVAESRIRAFHQQVLDDVVPQPRTMQKPIKPRNSDWLDGDAGFETDPHAVIPRVPTRYLYVVHLFSGAKRKWDLHECINRQVPPDGCSFMPISLDVVLDSIRGNLMARSNQDFWLLHAKRGRLYAIVAGPPCETWSVARWRHYEDGTGPRPLRTQQEVWGLGIMKLREMRQIITGNCLLHFALLMAAAQMVAGNLAFIEHPSEGERKPQGQPPSIWKLKAMQIMLMHERMGLFHLHQGLYGAVSPKPTTLLICCSPHQRARIEHCIRQEQTTSQMPRPLTMKKTETGYSTAPLKRYPKGFCMALASGIRHGGDHILPNTTEDDEISDIAFDFQNAYERTHESIHDGQDYFLEK